MSECWTRQQWTWTGLDSYGVLQYPAWTSHAGYVAPKSQSQSSAKRASIVESSASAADERAHRRRTTESLMRQRTVMLNALARKFWEKHLDASGNQQMGACIVARMTILSSTISCQKYLAAGTWRRTLLSVAESVTMRRAANTPFISLQTSSIYGPPFYRERFQKRGGMSFSECLLPLF